VTLLEEHPESPSIYHLFPIRVNKRDAFARSLDAEGVDTGIHYYPAIHAHPAWAGHDLRTGDVQNAEAWAAEELSLPIHPDVSDEELTQVIKAVIETAQSLGD
jgi:dTDP-4-amino-4,6-dideoxygalactose transaminase